jgi:hypothetical protein
MIMQSSSSRTYIGRGRQTPSRRIQPKIEPKMKNKEQKSKSGTNQKLPYEKPILHVLGSQQHTEGKNFYLVERVSISASDIGPS